MQVATALEGVSCVDLKLVLLILLLMVIFDSKECTHYLGNIQGCVYSEGSGSLMSFLR